jgi:hypothetical protein
MPVAVRLSKNFYARFGDEATNELIGVINDVAQSQDSSLKDAFAQQIAVFDAKLEQRLAETVMLIDGKVEQRFREARLESRFATVDSRFAEIRGEMKDMQSTLIRWMFLFWIGSALTIIGFR